MRFARLRFPRRFAPRKQLSGDVGLHSMADPATEFEQELEILRTEAEAATQFFYAYLTIHAVAAEQQPVYRLLNRTALFWNTALGALQTATFIALGRILDQSSAHNVDRVLKIAQKHPHIFSTLALGVRKQGNARTPPEWLPEYLRDAYVPKAGDFRRLRAHVRKRRKTYDEKYRDLRSKVFAHKELTEPTAVSALFAKTNVRELQRLLVFFSALHEALWQLFFNGRKPTLQPRRYSMQRMRDLPSPAERGKDVQERITLEAEQFLMAAASTAPQRIASDAPQAARG